jgi:hypothetical protein
MKKIMMDLLTNETALFILESTLIIPVFIAVSFSFLSLTLYIYAHHWTHIKDVRISEYLAQKALFSDAKKSVKHPVEMIRFVELARSTIESYRYRTKQLEGK